MRIINPDSLVEPRGYNHGIVASGNLLFIAGQIGLDQQGNFADGLAAQFGQALRNVISVVEAAGGKANQITRFTIFIKDKKDYLQTREAIGRQYRQIMGKHFPAMSLLVVKDLLEERALVEIEATAVL
jgi:enamine deaminase RidA (YjgF/YER057c/UK114 family)